MGECVHVACTYKLQIRDLIYFHRKLLYFSGMAKVLCPYCGEQIRFAPPLFGMPYCEKCGWKLEDAEKSSRQMALIMPFIALLGIIFFYRTIILGWPLSVRFIYLSCWVAFPASVGLLSWLDYRRIIVAEPQTVPPKPEDWLVRAASEYQLLLSLSVPRAVCISWKGWLRILIGVVCLAIIICLVVPKSSADFARPLRITAGPDAFPIGVLLLIGGWANLNLIRQLWSHRTLFKSGKVVIGRVVQQQFQNVRIGLDMIGRYSLVQYEFHDREGSPVSGGEHDYSKSLFREMPALIFYDEADPSRNVALGCSLYEIKTR